MLRSPSRDGSDNPDNHCRSTCDDLLSGLTNDSESEQDQLVPVEADGLLGCSEDNHGAEFDPLPIPPQRDPHRWKVFCIRSLALLCACSLSIGSHYATNILGPLKSRLQRELGTSNTQFGLLLAAYSLNSTWTPLVGGVLASRLGTTYTSILATGIIFLGQLLLLFGDIMHSTRLMALGLFVFGFGVSPLAVVQETIIVRFFKSQGLGTSMAFGLIAGKGASFLSARTAYPLTERFGPSAPFYVATALAGFSVITNLIYVSFSKWLIDGGEAELEAPDISQEARRRQKDNLSGAEALERVAQKRKVHFRQISKLGDIFWTYMALNLFCGMIWSPFTHLAPNIIQRRFGLSEEDAATEASYLLAGPLLLYPLCGYLVDKFKHRPIVIELLLLSSGLTMLAYIWFAISPSWTRTPVPGIFSFAIGHGFSPLLLVVLVPRIVGFKYISTALGAHKSLEQTGSTLFQTLSGLLLDVKNPNHSSLQSLLYIFVALNVLQCCTIFFLAFLQWRKDKALLSQYNCACYSTGCQESAEEAPLLNPSPRRRYSSISCTSSLRRKVLSETRSESELRRGKVLARISVGSVVATWILFLAVAWYRLGN